MIYKLLLKHMQHMTLHLVDANIAPPCYGRMWRMWQFGYKWQKSHRHRADM